MNRPGVTLLYRHGYVGRDQLVPYDRQRFMTYSRVTAAGNLAEPMTDLPVTLRVLSPVPSGRGELNVELTIDIARTG